MRTVVLLMALLGACLPAFGQEGGFIPWSEFKTLFRDSVEREVMKRTLAETQQKTHQVYSINEAHYTLRVEGESAQGEVLLSGRILSGEPEPIALFSKEVVVTGLERVTGGGILCSEREPRTCFLPDGTDEEFQLLASFLVRPERDDQSRIVSMGVPYALRNSLDLTLPRGARLVEDPGIADTDGIYHFSASPCLTVRYFDEQDPAVAAVIEIDALSRIQVQKSRILLTTTFAPVRPVPEAVVLLVPDGARYVSSSLKASRIKTLDEGRFELHVPADVGDAFSVKLALNALAGDGDVSFSLPRIEDNTGHEGRFVLDDLEDGEVTATAEGMVSDIPVDGLGEELRKGVEKHRVYARVPVNETITLTVKRFQTVATPDMVLDSQSFFSSFEENGNVLSVLIVDVPPEMGARMKLAAVPGAEVWSLTVNGASREVYAGEDDTWLIPLERGQRSHVELAFLTQGPKLGLQGRLEVVLPESGLPSREVCVGVALPERVELLSVEGPVSPARGADWELPAEFVGKPYLFSRAFYKGEGMTLAVAYKEPVNDGHARKGAPK